MDANDRDRRDAAGVGPYARERERLVPMSTLTNWHFPKGEPDIRGWEIRTVSGRQLGSVADLLIDQEAGEAVMIDVDLPGTDRHTYVPLRVAQVDREARVILMDSAEMDVADQPAVGAEPVVSARPVVAATEVADRRPLVDDTVVRRGDPDIRNDAGFSAAGAEADIDRRRAERRRMNRMGTDL